MRKLGGKLIIIYDSYEISKWNLICCTTDSILPSFRCLLSFNVTNAAHFCNSLPWKMRRKTRTKVSHAAMLQFPQRRVYVFLLKESGNIGHGQKSINVQAAYRFSIISKLTVKWVRCSKIKINNIKIVSE